MVCADACIVCYGSQCRPLFSDVTFLNCTLVALSGGQVTLHNSQFAGSHSHSSESSGVTIFAHGAGTRVICEAGNITQGKQAATVQAGARLEASNVAISRMELAGVEVKDEASSLNLSSCTISEFSSFICSGAEDVRGVLVHCSGVAVLSDVTISGMAVAVDVSTRGRALLSNCVVSDTMWEGVMFRDGGTGSMDGCVVSGSQSSQGLCVSGVSSSAKVARSHFQRNKDSGLAAFTAGSLTADSCKTSDNKVSGYQVHGKGSRLYLTGCTSNGDTRGCQATETGNLTATMVNVSGTEQSGFVAGSGGEAVLQKCSAVQCGVHGMYARDAGSRMEVHTCNVQQNVGCGVIADLGAKVEVTESCSSRNKMAGYQAQHQARLVVGNSFSNSDKGGCRVCDGGKLVMEGIREDGLLKTGVLT